MLDVGSQHNTAQRRRESNLRRAPLIETDDKAFLPLGNLDNCGALRSAWWCPTKNGVDSLTLRQVIAGSNPSGLGKCGALRSHGDVQHGMDSITPGQVIEGSIPSGLGKCGALRWHGGVRQDAGTPLHRNVITWFSKGQFKELHFAIPRCVLRIKSGVESLLTP